MREKNQSKRRPPAKTPEARENQLVSLAIDLAERQLVEGTASAQVITHYLKLGTTRDRLELEKLQRENELLKAKAEDISAKQHGAELYEQALKAFKYYHGEDVDDQDQDLY